LPHGKEKYLPHTIPTKERERERESEIEEASERTSIKILCTEAEI